MATQETTQEAPAAPVKGPGILTNDDPLLHKVVMTNILRGTTVEELKAWLVEKTDVTEENILAFDITKPKDEKKKTDIAKITFDSTLTTDKCLASLKKMSATEKKLKDNTMVMRRETPQFIFDDKRLRTNAHTISKKMFVNNLPQDKSINVEEELKNIIGPLVDSEETKILGEIEKYVVVMQRDPKTNEKTETPKGIGFVMVSSEELADKLAIQCGGGFQIGGQDITFKKNQDPEKRGQFGGGSGGYQHGGYYGGGGWDSQWYNGPPAYPGYGYGGGYHGGYHGGYQGYGGGYGF